MRSRRMRAWTFPLMNSESSLLDQLVREWQDVPFADAIAAAVAEVHTEVNERTTASFLTFLTLTSRRLLDARAHTVGCDAEVVGQAVVWLRQHGLLEELHLSFRDGALEAPTAIVHALRDACLEEVRRDHQRLMLTRRCSTFEQRVLVASKWLESHVASSRQPRAGWELADCIDDLLESAGAADRLLENLRAR